MTAIPIRQRRGDSITGAFPARDRLGVVFPLLLIWLFFEFGRPPNPLKIPLAISTVCLVSWLFRREKQWIRQTPWFVVLLVTTALGVPLAANTYAAFWSTWDMAILFLSICLPLQALITTVGRVRLWIFVFLGIALYVGGWAALHQGYGPSGSSGGQDENYIAAMMGMAIALTYFSLFAEKGRFTRTLMVAMLVVFLAAIALALNPSRGGFIGLSAVALYCLARSPKKRLGFVVVGVGVLALMLIAGPKFWTEIATSTDTTTDTANMRIEIWKAGLRMFTANPIQGVGAGNFRWVLDSYQTVEQLEKFGRSLGGSIIAHSFWVEMLSELGILGVLCTGILVWRTWRDLGRIRDDAQQRTKGPSPDLELLRFRCYADALRAGMLAILVNGVFLSLFYYSHLWLLLAVSGGMIYLYRARGFGAPVGLAEVQSAPVRPAVARRGGPSSPFPARSRGVSVSRRGRQ